MPILTTGVTRTLTWTSTIAGTWAGKYVEGPNIAEPYAGFALGYLQMGVSNWYCRVDHLAEIVGAKYDVGVQITAYNGVSTDHDHVSVTEYDLPTPGGHIHNWEKEWSGSWTITCQVEECLDVGVSVETNARYSPWDPPDHYTARLFERLIVGTPITASLTVNGGTVSVSDNATIATEVSRNLIAEWELAVTDRTDGLSSTTPTINGNDVEADAGWDTGAWQVECSGGISITGTGGASPSTGHLSANIWRPRAYTLGIVAKAMEHDYPASLTFNVDRYSGAGIGSTVIATGGVATDSYAQRVWSVSATLAGTTYTNNLSESYPVAVRANSASLAENHEDDKEHDPAHIYHERDTWTQLRGPWATVGTVVHADQTTVESFANATESGGDWYTSDCPYGYWEGGADVAIDAPTSDRMRAVYTGGTTGTISRYYPLSTTEEPQIEWSGYRWLKVRFRCVDVDGVPIDGQTFVLTVNPNNYSDGWQRTTPTAKTWTVEGRLAGASEAQGWVERYIDLCSPDTPALPNSEGGAHCAEKSIAIYRPDLDPPRFEDWWYEEAVQDSIDGQEGNIDARWPIPQIDGVMSGVTCPAFVEPIGYGGLTSDVQTGPGLTVSGMAPNVYYDFDYMLLVRRNAASVDLVPSRRWWARLDRNWESVSQADEIHWHKWSQEPDDWDQALKSWTWYARNVLGIVDGRQSMERPYAYRVVVETPDPSYGNTISYYQVDCKNIIEGVGGLNGVYNKYYDPLPATGALVSVLLGYVRESAGWSATESTASIAGRAVELAGTPMTVAEYMNANRPAYWLGGAGWRAINGGWESGFDIDTTTAADLVCQMLFDTMQWYPDCGDAFGFGGGDGLQLVLRAAKVLRGEGHGIVLTPAGDVAPDCVVDLTPGAGAGTSVAGTGRFVTGLPTGPGHVDHGLIQEDPATADEVQYHSLHARKRSRGHFLATPPSGTVPSDSLSYDVSAAMRHVVAYIYGQLIWLRFATSVRPTVWGPPITTLIMKTEPCIRWAKGTKEQQLWLVATDTDTLLMYRSDNEGRTWSVPTTVMTATHGALCCLRMGARYVAGRKSDGSIAMVAYDNAGNVMLPEFTAVASGCDDDDIALEESIIGGGVHQLALLYLSGGALTTVVSTDGKTFT